MPHDELDGIHTRLGRVVYDRKKSNFSIRDLCRILKKAGATAVENSDTVDDDVFLLCVFSEAIKTLLRIVTTDFSRADRYLSMVSVMNEKLESDWEGFGGGKFGGGGASRTV